jgi:hypothetical protein
MQSSTVLHLVEIGAEDEENDRQKSVLSQSPIMERQSQREGDWRRDLIFLSVGIVVLVFAFLSMQ